MISLFAWILAFVVAITIHETAHAWMADRLGDPTPRAMGRLSLNPMVHYDRVGTTLLLVLVILKGLAETVPGFQGFRYIIPFGWAKPVQFDPYNLKNPRRDAALISLAGPFSNIALAILLSILARLLTSPFSPLSFIYTIMEPMIILNIVLAIFNLLPIHPLDGGKVLVGLLPRKEAYEADLFMKRYGLIILFLLIFPAFGGVSPIFLVISPIINFFLGVLIPGNPIV